MSSSAPTRHRPAHNRRRYLLNPRFQLKYTALLVSVALTVMLMLGIVIWRTASIASDQAQLATTEAERAVKESATSARILRMSAASYGDAPDLGRALEEDLVQIDRTYEHNLAEVAARRIALEQQRRRILYLLVGGGAGVLLVLGVLGIFITHRIVGPVHRLKRLCRQVGTSRLTIGERLRKGDELEDLFDTFVQMTYSLKALQSGRLATLDATIEKAEAESIPPEVMKGLRALRAQLCLGLTDAEVPQRLSRVTQTPARKVGA